MKFRWGSQKKVRHYLRKEKFYEPLFKLGYKKDFIRGLRKISSEKNEDLNNGGFVSEDNKILIPEGAGWDGAE